MSRCKMLRRPAPRRNEEGFTLVELLVVLAILALLAAVAAPQVMRYLSKARTDTTRMQLNNIMSGLELYYLDVGGYPANLADLVTAPNASSEWKGPYLKKAQALSDAWGNPYLYRMPGQHGPYDLYSLGRDQAEGGDGENQDLSSW